MAKVMATNAVVFLLAERIKIILIWISSIALTTISLSQLHFKEEMESMYGMCPDASILISSAVTLQIIRAIAILKFSKLLLSKLLRSLRLLVPSTTIRWA